MLHNKLFIYCVPHEQIIINSKANKLAEIQTLTELNECDILCVSETWLDCKITDFELLSNTEFS